MDRKFFIKTFGCQMNVYDSDYMAQCLINMGWSSTNNPEEADLVLVNTCTVRAKPEQKASTTLGRLSRLKKKRPHMILGVVGCLAQEKGEELMERFPLLDFAVGPREIAQIKETITKAMEKKERVVALDLDEPPPEPDNCPGYFQGRVTAFISIMQGCNNFCSYCIVPYVRGREASRAPQQILQEARSLLRQGVREITLLGQNVNSYLWESDKERWDFPRLLREVGGLPGLLRLRFTTSHPKDLSEGLIASFGQIETLCPHIHLPFQAGSNRVLELMKRGYTKEDYIELIENLRSVRPEIAITADVMVGFPGETDEDFHHTMDLIQQVEFDGLFSFKYSDRAGTLAATMEPKVPEEEKAERLKILQEFQKQVTFEKNKRLIGKTVKVLVEGPSRRKGQYMGRTPTNKIVNFPATEGNSLVGKEVTLKIKRANLNSLIGSLLN